jgi:hypothetical protein
MRKQWHVLLAVSGLLFQAVAIAFMHGIAQTVYENPPYSGESWGWMVSVMGLALCAGISTLLGGSGAYALLTRSRLAVAIALIVLCCIPALIGGAVYGYGLLVFLTLV